MSHAKHPPTRRQRRSTETRERIFRAALKLFSEQGFFETRVEDITEAADVGKGTFFNYFPSKEHLLGGFGELQVAKVAQARETILKGKKPLREGLKRLFLALGEEPGRSQGLVRAGLSALLSSPAVRGKMRRNLWHARKMLKEMIIYGQKRGKVRRGLSPAQTALAMQQIVLGTIFLWALHHPTRIEPWLERAFDVFWYGIAFRSGNREQ
jgi:AcrR family transcriptional regulator